MKTTSLRRRVGWSLAVVGVFLLAAALVADHVSAKRYFGLLVVASLSALMGMVFTVGGAVMCRTRIAVYLALAGSLAGVFILSDALPRGHLAWRAEAEDRAAEAIAAGCPPARIFVDKHAGTVDICGDQYRVGEVFPAADLQEVRRNGKRVGHIWYSRGTPHGDPTYVAKAWFAQGPASGPRIPEEDDDLQAIDAADGGAKGPQ